MSEYTKGPWTFEPPWSGFSTIRGQNGELVFGIAAGGAEEKQPDNVCEANASLIAAAPDLLEALEAFLNWYVHFVNSGDAGFWDPEKDDIVIKARSALSKAKGET